MCGGCRVTVGGETQVRLRRRPGVRRARGGLRRCSHAATRCTARSGGAALRSNRLARDRDLHRPTATPGWPRRGRRPAPRTRSRGAKDEPDPQGRVEIPGRAMPEQTPEVARHNFDEVNLGFDPRAGRAEAQRCFQCAKPEMRGRLSGRREDSRVRRPGADGEYVEAAAKIREDNVLPAITGRVCPQEIQCEGACVARQARPPVAIGHLERFVADYERRQAQVGLPGERPADRQEGGDRRQRPGRADLRRRPGPAGPCRDRVRGAARDRRRAGVRHPRVSPAQGDRRARSRRTCGDWASSSDQRASSAQRSRSTSCSTRKATMRSSSAPAPDCRSS